MNNKFNHNIFVQNDHLIEYLRLVENVAYAPGTYTERHHIIPECLFLKRTRKGPKGWLTGNANTKDNIVYLTPFDHYRAHKLLTMFTTGAAKHKMMYALSAFIRNNSKRMLSPEIIQEARQASSLANIGNTNNKDKFYFNNGIQQRLCYTSPGPEWTTGKLSQVRDWWNNGQQESMGTCPGPDWVKGRLRRRWWTNGKEDLMSTICPGPDWSSGRTQQIGMTPWNNGTVVKLSTTCPGPGWQKGKIPVENKWWHTKDGQRQLSTSSPGPDWVLGFGGDNWSKNTKFWHKNGIVKRSTKSPGEGWREGVGKEGNQLNKTWYNNGVNCTLAHEPPGPDYIKGRIKKQ
jgi:hypothetical protein